MTGDGWLGGLYGGASCEEMNGTMLGTISHPDLSISFGGTFQTFGSSFLMVGTAIKEPFFGPFTFSGTITAIPSLGGPNCLSWGQSQFLLSGIGTYTLL